MSSREDRPEEPTATEPARYVAFLEHWRAETKAPLEGLPRGDASYAGLRSVDGPHGDPESPAAAPAAVAPLPPEGVLYPSSGLRIPRRRDAAESIRVRLAPEQLYWLHLAAARAGEKVDASLIVAAGLALLERLPIDWRRVRTRRELALAVEEAMTLSAPPSQEEPVAPEGPGTPATDR